MIRKLSMGILLFFVLSVVYGCAGIKDDGTRTRTEGAGTGAAAGAVVGAIIGQLAGGSTEATLLGAAIGGAIGGVGGYAYGDHVAGQKEKYATEEDWLEACIAEAKKSNEEIVAYNQNLEEQIILLRNDTDSLQQKYADVETKNIKLLEKKKEVDELLELANIELAEANAELGAQSNVVTDAKQTDQSDYVETLDSEIEALRANIKELEKQTEELASLSASMSV